MCVCAKSEALRLKHTVFQLNFSCQEANLTHGRDGNDAHEDGDAGAGGGGSFCCDGGRLED